MPRVPSVFASPPALLGLALVTALGACADGPTTPGAARPVDAWLGTSYVTTDGVFHGTNNVTSELDGCVVVEHWNDAGEVLE